MIWILIDDFLVHPVEKIAYKFGWLRLQYECRCFCIWANRDPKSETIYPKWEDWKKA